jgi:diguanylate cyclase (GGDEF)-like protein
MRAIATPRVRLVLRVATAAGIAAVVFHIMHHAIGLGGRQLDDFTYNWLYDAVIVGAALACLARAALVEREQLPWLVLGIGLLLDATGEIYYSLTWGDSGTPPIPSLADLFYLLYYPAAYVALILLVRARMDRFRASMWLDGAIVATALTALVAVLAFDPIVSSATRGNAAAVATNLAYPVGDLVLLATVAVVFALAGWRPGRAWLLLGIGLAVWAIADTSYVAASSTGTYVVGGLLDTLWMGSAFLIGVAAWQRVPGQRNLCADAPRLLLIPVTFAVVSIGLLIYGSFHHEQPVAVLLAGTAVLLVVIRAAWTFYENMHLLEASQHEAITDSLTGLGNRRLMHTELAAALADGIDSPPSVLLMFDLDGFKLYNDQFGHLAGDTMLAHLGHRLREAVVGIGSAFRLGGDEFCVLLRCGFDSADIHVAAAIAALTSEGEGFSVGATHGRVELPSEAHMPTYALRLADNRMYAKKGTGRGSATQQTHDVLLGVLREREPELHHHLQQVGQLAAIVASKLGLDPGQIDDIRRAAELHDIGKAAIPDAILNKPGPLNDYEWAFMRRHTYVGERILAAAPSLAPVASLVRSSHERWDGAGYPDGLAGAAIPLGARIISVCDAYDAMISDRPYALAMAPAAAIAELHRCAGTQFDPQVVDAFVHALHEAQHPNKPAAGDDTLRAA